MPEKRFVIAGEVFRARQAIFITGFANKPNNWLCPYCKDERAKNIPVGDIIQYGFEWDTHTTILQCNGCRKLMYGTYDVWLTRREARKRNV